MFAKGTIYLDRRVESRHPRWVNRSASCGGVIKEDSLRILPARSRKGC
jgi:hypothetical protein